MSEHPDVTAVRAQLRADLVTAMKAKDAASVRAFRTTIAAIDNAEAVDGTGVDAAEVARHELTFEDVVRIVGDEVDERRAAIAEYERVGQAERAGELRAEVAALLPHRPVG